MSLIPLHFPSQLAEALELYCASQGKSWTLRCACLCRMHDQAEGPAGGTLAGNVDMRTGEKAGPEDVGKYRGE